MIGLLVLMTLIFLTKSFNTSFLITFLSTTSLNFLNSTETVVNLSTSNLSTLLFKLFKTLGTFFNSSKSNSSTDVFQLAKLVFLANFDVSTPVALLNPILLHN